MEEKSYSRVSKKFFHQFRNQLITVVGKVHSVDDNRLTLIVSEDGK